MHKHILKKNKTATMITSTLWEHLISHSMLLGNYAQ